MIRNLAGGVSATVLVVLLPASVAQAEDYQCQGQPATIVGSDTEYVDGTPGDDVIVVPRAYLGVVKAGGGNDLVCVVDGPDGQVPDLDDARRVSIHLMDGDDVFVNESAYVGEELDIDPGKGADVVIGGPEGESIDAPWGSPTRDTEADRYLMGAGDDSVDSGVEELANSDEIDLGPGNDHLDFAGPLGLGGRIEGGTGSDELHPGCDDEAPDLEDTEDLELGTGRLVLDNRVGTATLDGAPFLAWTGIEDFDLYLTDCPSVFVGGDQDEHLNVGETVVSADLGGGDDTLDASDAGYGSAFEGGAGRDKIEVGGITVRLDLRGDLAVEGLFETEPRHVAVHGFEDASVGGFYVWIRGTAAAQRLKVWAYRNFNVRGFGGDDEIILRRLKCDCASLAPPAKHRSAWGGAGNDRLEGTDAADLLVGGPGHDIANGKAGIDRCDTEIHHRCEPR